MADYYFHYTSRENAQSILSSGRMEAGVSGWIYLSLDAYDQGARAADALAIEGKAIEVVGLLGATDSTGKPTSASSALASSGALGCP